MAVIGGGAVATGQISYVVTSGVSMEPVYHQNDLIIVIQSDSYQIGEIAAYHGTVPGLKVLHRIVGGDAENGFVFKGDNNPANDPRVVTAEALIGHAALLIPKGGVWLKPLFGPTGLGMFSFLLFGAAANAPRTRREIPRGRRKKRVKAMERQGGPMATALAVANAVRRLPPVQQAAAVVLVFLAAVGLVLGILGYMKSAVEVRKASGPTQSMVFSYSASVPRSAAYDGTVASSPDPIFRKLANKVDVRMRYQGDPGTFSATAAISTETGWHTKLQLTAPQKFAGRSHEAAAALDLNAIDDRAHAAAKVIGAESETVTIVLSAQVNGATSFTAPLRLTLTPVELGLSNPDATSLTVKGGGATEAGVVARRIGFLTAGAARSWAVFLLIVSAAGAAGLYLLAHRSAALRTRTDIERRYSQLLVHVEPMPSPPGKPVVNVDNFPALVKLAEKYGQMILTWRRPDADDFVVRDEGITYRYRIPHDEPTLQNVELIGRPGAGSHRRKTSSPTQVS